MPHKPAPAIKIFTSLNNAESWSRKNALYRMFTVVGVVFYGIHRNICLIILKIKNYLKKLP